MPHSPLFSIIIPTYNRAHLIGKAIKSVKAQSFNDWELIIVDDGSKDETREVVKAYQEERITYFFQQNKELNGARNAGIRLARGSYLCFLDDDDHFLINHLLVLNHFILQHDYPIAALKTGMIQVEKGREIHLPFYNEKKESPVTFIWKRTPNLLSFAFHREIFQRELFDERYLLFEDHHFLYRVINQFPLYQIPHHTVVYLAHLDSRSSNYYLPEHVQNKIACINDLFNRCGDQISAEAPSNLRQRIIAGQYLHFANLAIKDQKINLAFEYLRKGIKHGVYHYELDNFLLTGLRWVIKGIFSPK